MANVFSLAAFFVVLREAFEAALVTGIALAYCSRMGLDHQRKFVWYGVASGIVASIILALGFAIPSWVGGGNVFEGKTEHLFEGFTMLVAALLLTWMIMWMIVVGDRLRQNLEGQIEQAVASDKRSDWALLLLIFFQIFREGAETVIFLFGITSGGDSVPSLIMPAILGLIVAIGLAYLLFRGLLDVNVERFFFWSSVFLIFFAAGIFARAWHEFQEADWFGAYEDVDSLDRPWWNAVMWDTSGCCSDENQFFALMRALFGYQDDPTFVELMAYFGYWFALTAIYAYMRWDWLSARSAKLASYLTPSSTFLFFCCFVGMVYALINRTWTGILFTWSGLLLSILGMLVSYRVVKRLLRVPLRWMAIMSMTQWIAGMVLAVFAVTVIGAQLACDDAAGSASNCFLPSFYWWLLILDDDFNTAPQAATHFNSIAVLAICQLFTTLFCMYHSVYGYFHQKRTWNAYRRRMDSGEESEEVLDRMDEEAGMAREKAQQWEPSEKAKRADGDEFDSDSDRDGINGAEGDTAASTTAGTEEVRMTAADDNANVYNSNRLDTAPAA